MSTQQLFGQSLITIHLCMTSLHPGNWAAAAAAAERASDACDDVMQTRPGGLCVCVCVCRAARVYRRRLLTTCRIVGMFDGCRRLGVSLHAVVCLSVTLCVLVPVSSSMMMMMTMMVVELQCWRWLATDLTQSTRTRSVSRTSTVLKSCSHSHSQHAARRRLLSPTLTQSPASPTDVACSVCVGHTGESCKNGRTDRYAVWGCQLYKNISMLFLFPVKDGKLSTGVNATFNASCYG